MTTSPYILGYEPNVSFKTIATVGDTLDGASYRMVGIPDGLGAFDNGDGTITVLMNHELGNTVGVVRDHGAIGAFVSKWTLDKATLSVVTADDAIQTMMLWNDGASAFEASTYAANRFCSGNLADTSALYWVDDLGDADASNDVVYGTQEHIYLTGEEGGTEGKAFAVLASGADAGKAFELAYSGMLAFENAVASPFAQKQTIVAETDDGQGGQVYFYIGEKQATGSDVEKAGLVGGNLFGVQVTGLNDGTIAGVTNGNETDAAAASGRFTLFNQGDVSAKTGLEIDTQSESNGVTSFNRPEDGHWDPTNPNVFWFVTTASMTGQSRLYKMTFDDINDLSLGGTIEAVLSSSDLPNNDVTGPRMMDNITVNEDGKIIIQEDPGNNAHLSRIFEYDPSTDSLTVVGQFDPALYTGTTPVKTLDEESSGVIDVTSLVGYTGGNAYLLDAQSHNALVDPELVQDGQFLAMFVNDVVTTGTRFADTLNGSALAENFVGRAGDDVIKAGSGNDIANGGLGNDTLSGGAGDDTLRGADGNDVLNGGTGNDTLNGFSGDDVLTGGSGLDRLIGGLGADIFVFNAGDSTAIARDMVADFDRTQGDQIDLSSLNITITDLSIVHGVGVNYTVAADIDHDGSADLVFQVRTSGAFDATDFIL